MEKMFGELGKVLFNRFRGVDDRIGVLVLIVYVYVSMI